MSTQDDIEEDLPRNVGEEAESEEGNTTASQDTDEVNVLRDRVADLEEAKLRMVAEMQNTRKRLVKQREEDYKYRHQDLLLDLVGVIDNFERAIIVSVESGDFNAFHEGITMIEKQFTGMLTEKYNLERFGEVGEAFDPAAHEAMMMEESPDVDGEVIKQVYQAGYRLHSRVLRPAKVVVAKPVQEGSASGNEDADNENKKQNNEVGVE